MFAACEMSNSEIYDESYFEERYVDYEAALTGQSAQWRINFYRALLAVASRLARGRRLLDVGCGLGEFLEAARQAGWEAEGLDISEAACRVASERTGCPTRACELGPDTYAPSSFDAVAAIDLLEHLPDPRATLGHIRTILKPDAVLVVVTPNLNGLSTRLFGAANYALDASSAGPGHVQFFSPRSLGSLLQLTGFEVV
ncbi:MAG: class I SAM-dependent methyltransferase, partial [Armatimonadota bacterium]